MIKKASIKIVIFSFLLLSPSLVLATPGNFQSIISKAMGGDVTAQYYLGILYTKTPDNLSLLEEIFGKITLENTERDIEKAQDWLTKSANQGEAKAQSELSRLLRNGRGLYEPYKDCKKALYWAQKSADQGEKDGQFRIGEIYAAGCDDIAESKKESIFWYEKAAKQGHSDAQYWLWWAYRDGEGARKDSREGMHWLEKAAKQGHSDAQLRLSWAYRDGEGVAKDHIKATYWLEKAAPYEPIAVRQLARLYLEGDSTVRNIDKAILLFEQIAAVDYTKKQYSNRFTRKIDFERKIEAQIQLGDIYFELKDYEKAIYWYEKAAQVTYEDKYSTVQERLDNIEEIMKKTHAYSRGSIWAQFQLGNMYYDGIGVKQDFRESTHWYLQVANHDPLSSEKFIQAINDYYTRHNNVWPEYGKDIPGYKRLADLGKISAYYIVAEEYRSGFHYLPKDIFKAVEYYLKAAKQGHATAQVTLGGLYSHKEMFTAIFKNYLEGLPKDMRKSAKWYRKAAEQGHANAQVNLALMYDEGEGVTQDYKEAIKWYGKAAEQGDAIAQNNLAIKYAQGLGVPQDYVLAHKWFNLAAAGGDEDAQNNRDIVANKMTPTQLAEAQKLAREWVPQK